MSRTFATWAAAATMLLGVAGLAIAGNTSPAAGEPDICAGLDSGKIDTSGDPATVTITAPAGSLITSYCVKAGSSASGGGPVYVPVEPPAESVTFAHPTGKAVSHYSYSFEPVDRPTTTLPPESTTLPPPTTVPEPTTSLPEVTTTTTVPEPTTTPVATSVPEQTTTTSTPEQSTTTTSVQSSTTTTVRPPTTPRPIVTRPPTVTLPVTL